MTEKDKQTEDKIFEAAKEIFIKKGMDGTRMQDIADQAGINKSLLHYYYRSKERLFNAVFDKVAAKIVMMFAPVFEENMTLEEKIRFFYKEHISFMQKNPGLPAFILNELNRNPSRVTKLISGFDINKLRNLLEKHHKEELDKNNITIENFSQILTSIVSLSIFPFVAKTIISVILQKLELDFDEYIENRKEFAADFVIDALLK